MQGRLKCSNVAEPGDFLFTVLEQVKSCGSVSCQINTDPLELLRLQSSELIASKIVGSKTETFFRLNLTHVELYSKKTQEGERSSKKHEDFVKTF